MSQPSSPFSINSVSAAERVFGWREHASLWFSLGVGLLVMQVGAYLVPAMGTREALLAVVLGSVFGAGLLAWVAYWACESGLSSAGLMHAVYGRGFARLPVALNVLQLLGWATFELVIMRDGTRAIARELLGLEIGLLFPTLIWGLIVLALLRFPMVTLVRRIVSRIGLPLVVLSLIWLTVQFALKLDSGGLQALWQREGDGSMNGFQAFDLVIAMPVSWLPLVADYARHGRARGSAAAGTWVGYTLANIWCYLLGVLVITATSADADIVTALLLAQGGLIALGLILVDELDNTYGDLYSGSVCTYSLLPRMDLRNWGTVLAVLAILFALVLPMHALEPFLLLLSSVFVPLFGTILGRLAARAPDPAAAMPLVRVSTAIVWLLGVGVYHALASWAPQYGSSLPTLLLTFVLGWVTALATREAGQYA